MEEVLYVNIKGEETGVKNVVVANYANIIGKNQHAKTVEVVLYVNIIV